MTSQADQPVPPPAGAEALHAAVTRLQQDQDAIAAFLQGVYGDLSELAAGPAELGPDWFMTEAELIAARVAEWLQNHDVRPLPVPARGRVLRPHGS